MVDLYAVLGVAATADARDIRRAYLRRVRQYHPDRDPRPESTEHFHRVQAAYDELGDEVRRQRYDASHHDAARVAPAPVAPRPSEAPRCELHIPRGRMSVKVRLH
jgi:curved DNA-binding protein CbpA